MSEPAKFQIALNNPEDINTTEQEATTQIFRVEESAAGTRLDAFLAAQIADWSRARLQRLIEDGDVLLNGRAAKSSSKLRAGDEIEVELIAPAINRFAPENIPLDIVYEDDELIIVNKQAGLIVHPAAGVPSGTLANALAYHFQHLPQSAGEARPGLVHRLDRDTSGLIMVAKTEVAHEHLTEQFRARQVFKSYVALVHGRVATESGRIDAAIARDPRNRTRMATVRAGRPSLSLYRVRQRYERFTLLDVEIKTGRTHQIRVHLQWLKHPVAGDPIYGDGRDKTVADARLRARIAALGRQFLHAEQLGFRHPRTDEVMRFKSPLPGELAELLENLETDKAALK